MKKQNLFKYFISCGAIIYTIGSMLIISTKRLMDGNTVQSAIYVKPLLYFFIFSYIIALGNTLFKVESISAPTRRVIHAASYIFGVFTFLRLCGMLFYAAMIISGVFAVIYVLVVFVSALISGNMGRLSVPNAPNAKAQTNSNKKHSSTNNQTNNKSKAKDNKQSSKDEYKKRFS